MTTHKAWELFPKAFRFQGFLLCLLTVIGVFVELLGLGLIVPTINIILNEEYLERFPQLASFGFEAETISHADLIFYSLSALVTVYMVKALFLTGLNWWQATFIYELKKFISDRLMTVYMHSPYEFHLAHNSGFLTRNLTGEMQHFVNLFVIPIITLYSELILIVGVFFLLFYNEPLGTFIVAALVIFLSTVYQSIVTKRLKDWGKKRQINDGLRIKAINEGLLTIKDSKLLGRTEFFLKRFVDHATGSAFVESRQLILSNMPRIWLEVVGVLSLSVLILTVNFTSDSSGEMISSLGLFAAAAFRTLPSVNRILRALHSIRWSDSAVHLLSQELQRPIPIRRPKNEIVFAGSIDVEGVSYVYPSAKKPVFSNVQLTIERGESIGIIGETGSGKSTFANVFLGLLSPTTGRILVDQIDVSSSIESWQSLIGYVPQETYLIDASIRENIAFGVDVDAIDDEAVTRALYSAQLHTFVSELEGGIHSKVGERGIKLSGGQRQRIGVARALYRNPPILVLDEATSALDYDTETNLMDAIRSLSNAKTTIIIAHRTSTVEHCNRIFSFQSGMLKQQI